MRVGHRTAAALLVLVTAATAPSAVAGPASVMGATTVIHTGAAAYADVVVSRDAWVSTPFDAVPDLSVSDHEGLAAFALVGRSGRAQGTVLIGGADGATPFLLPLPEYPKGAGGHYGQVRTYGDRTAVPAGTYRLYTIGVAATLTLRLRGLAGRGQVRPTHSASVAMARNDVAALDTTNDFTGVGTRRLSRPGLVFEVLSVRSEISVGWQLTMCYRHSRPSIPESAWAHGCPDAQALNNSVHRFPDATPTAYAFVQGVVGAPVGDVVQTAWFTAAAKVTSVDYATVWITPF